MSTAGPAHRVQSAVVEYGYPNGHLGHLTTEEEAAFKNFKLLCTDKGEYKPAEGETPASHDDATLLYVAAVCVPILMLTSLGASFELDGS